MGTNSDSSPRRPVGLQLGQQPRPAGVSVIDRLVDERSAMSRRYHNRSRLASGMLRV